MIGGTLGGYFRYYYGMRTSGISMQGVLGLGVGGDAATTADGSCDWNHIALGGIL
jgi:hypothetical protein